MTNPAPQILRYKTEDVLHHLRLRHDAPSVIIQESLEDIGAQYWVFEPLERATGIPTYKESHFVWDKTDLEWNPRPDVHRQLIYDPLAEAFTCTVVAKEGIQKHTVRLREGSRLLELTVDGPQRGNQKLGRTIFERTDVA